MTEEEVEQVSEMRDVHPDAFRHNAGVRRWLNRYRVRVNLATNPAVPVDVALSVLPTLTKDDLRRVANNAELAPGVRETADQLHRRH